MDRKRRDKKHLAWLYGHFPAAQSSCERMPIKVRRVAIYLELHRPAFTAQPIRIHPLKVLWSPHAYPLPPDNRCEQIIVRVEVWELVVPGRGNPQKRSTVFF